MQLAAAAGVTAGGTANLASHQPKKREQVDNPEKWSEVVYIDSNFQDQDCKGSNGTGVLIDDFHVLTAAHIVYDQDNSCESGPDTAAPEKTYVYPARDSSCPYYRSRVTHIRVFDDYKETQKSRYDFALLTLDRSVGKYAGSLPIFATDNERHKKYKESVRAVGYPDLKPPDQLWIFHGSGHGIYNIGDILNIGGILNIGDILIDYNSMHELDIDTEDGNSGGPVINDEDEIVSIVSTRRPGGWLVPPRTFGVRFTKQRHRWVTDAKEEDRKVRKPNDKPLPIFNRPPWDGGFNPFGEEKKVDPS